MAARTGKNSSSTCSTLRAARRCRSGRWSRRASCSASAGTRSGWPSPGSRHPAGRRDERGRYRLGERALAIGRRVRSWRDRRIARGRGAGAGWRCTRRRRGARSSGTGARPAPVRLRALRPGLWVRPDNLASGSTTCVASWLRSACPPATWSQPARPGRVDGAARPPPVGRSALRRSYRRSAPRSPPAGPPAAAGARGGHGGVVRSRRPRPARAGARSAAARGHLPADERDALLEQMRRYDRLGRLAWATLLQRFDVPSLRSPVDVRADETPARTRLTACTEPPRRYRPPPRRRPAAWRAALSQEEIHDLLRVRDLRAWLSLAINWGVIFAAFALVAAWPNPLTVVAALCLIGTRQLGGAALMHDAAHRALFRNRRLNDWVGNWLAPIRSGATPTATAPTTSSTTPRPAAPRIPISAWCARSRSPGAACGASCGAISRARPGASSRAPRGSAPSPAPATTRPRAAPRAA